MYKSGLTAEFNGRTKITSQAYISARIVKKNSITPSQSTFMFHNLALPDISILKKANIFILIMGAQQNVPVKTIKEKRTANSQSIIAKGVARLVRQMDIKRAV